MILQFGRLRWMASLLSSALVLFLATAPSAATPKYVALVVGVAKYNGQGLAELPSPDKDANAIAAALEQYGFQVYRLLDPDVVTFQRGLNDFFAAAQGADAAVFFYSGHGAQVSGENYLLPLDGMLDSVAALKRDFVTVSALLENLDRTGARFKFVILDACRNNPFVSANGMVAAAILASAGLAAQRIPPGTGTLVSFASAPGQVSLDTGSVLGFSLYTAALLAVMQRAERIEVHDLTAQSRNLVVEATRSHPQIPWEQSSLIEPFYFEKMGHGGVVDVLPEIPYQRPSSGFIFPDSDRRQISPADLAGRSAGELRIARNEIFARRGRIFVGADLRAYFSQFPWYRPRDSEVDLSDIESANVALIFDAERAAPPAPVQARLPTRDFVFSDSDRRPLTAADVAHLSSAELRVARNEIFARRGRYFDSDDLKRRFGSFAWYHPYTWNPDLNDVERGNVEVILNEERRR